MASQRMHWVDNLKGFLIFLVVVGHILQSAIDAHIDTEVMSCIFDWIYSFHMPLFFAASGYVYSLTLRKSLSDEKFAGKWKKRIITLIYLYFVYSFLMWGFKYCFSSFSLKESVDLTTLFFLPLKPISVYWFLYLLIIYFVIVPLWEKYVNYINCKTLLMMFVAQIVSMHIDLPFYFNRIIYMLPFFAAGTLTGDLKKSGYELKLLSRGMLTLFVVCLCDMQPPEWT